MIDAYIKKIASITKRGDAREESYYPALAALLEEFSETERKKKAHVTVLPKKTEAGNPDFRVWDAKHSQVGYVEAKPPKANLDDIETSDQLKRYVSTFPNLILTNFYEFRLYRNGQRVANVLLARPYIPTKLKAIPPAEHTDEFLALLEKFFQFSLPTKFTAESLAKELATRTRFLRDQVIKEELRETSSTGAKKILGFYEAFQRHLIFNLKLDEFADLYAQTITYGLFAARTRANGAFNRILAYDLIPKTIGILRDIFHFVSFDPPEQFQATLMTLRKSSPLPMSGASSISISKRAREAIRFSISMRRSLPSTTLKSASGGAFIIRLNPLSHTLSALLTPFLRKDLHGRTGLLRNP